MARVLFGQWLLLTSATFCCFFLVSLLNARSLAGEWGPLACSRRPGALQLNKAIFSRLGWPQLSTLLHAAPGSFSLLLNLLISTLRHSCMRPPGLASCPSLHSLKQCLFGSLWWLLKVSFGSCGCLDALPYSPSTVHPLGSLPALSFSPWGDCLWEKEESLGSV